MGPTGFGFPRNQPYLFASTKISYRRTIKDARSELPVEVYCSSRLRSQHFALTSQYQGLARPYDDLGRCLGHGAPATFINLINPNLGSQIPQALFIPSAHTYLIFYPDFQMVAEIIGQQEQQGASTALVVGGRKKEEGVASVLLVHLFYEL